MEGKMKLIKNLIFLILVSSLVFQSCSHIITTPMVGSQDSFPPDSGYIYGCFQKQFFGLYIGKGDQAHDLIIALEIKSVEDQSSPALTVHIPFREALGQLDLQMNRLEEHADATSGKQPQIVKIPPGVYRVTNVIFATSSGRIKSRKSLPSYPVFENIKVQPGVLTYIGSWKGTTTASGVEGFDGSYNWMLRKVYDFFIEETYRLEREFPKTKQFRKYNAFTNESSDRLPILVAALKSDNENIRAGAAAELGEIGDPKAVHSLIEILKDRDKDVVKNSILALGKIGDKRAVNPLITMLNDKDIYVRGFAVSALGKIGDSRSVDYIFAAINDNDKFVQEGAVRALGKIGDAHSVELLIAILKDKDKHVRMAAATALGNTGDITSLTPLIAALKDKDKIVRGEVAAALGQIGDSRAIDTLTVVALKDKESYVQVNAARALGKLSDEATTLHFINILEENPDTRASAARVLGAIGDIRAVEPLITALTDQDELARRSAADALGKIKDARAIEPLIAAIKDDDVYVRKSSIRILGFMGDDRAVEPLIAALKDQDATVRRFAARALGHYCDPRVVTSLITFLKSEDEHSYKNHAMVNAAYSLKEITNKEFGTDHQKWAEWWKKNKKNFHVNTR